MKVPLTGSAYTARSLIASAQRSVNLYAEHNPQDSPFPATYYLTPGLTTIATAAQSSWRQLYTATNGVTYGVCGNTLYEITGGFALTSRGTISSTLGPVSMVDNGLQILIVDGSSSGWAFDFGTLLTTPVSDPAFYGGDRVDLVDGFFVLNRPGTNQFYISGFLSTTFDPLDFAAKTGFSDKLVAVAVAKRQIFLIGQQTTEVWYNSGGATFPFTRMPGAFVQFGCSGAATVQQVDGSVYWLSRSPQGECLVLRTENYERARISTFAIEQEFQSYANVADATSYTYQQGGHTFYVLNFPSANKTWVFDLATSEWHERTFMDGSGQENRQRANCHAQLNGVAIVGDWQSGKLYKLDSNVYTDDGAPIHRIRSFPHLLDNANRVMYKTLIADMEVGQGLPVTGAPPEIRLRWSDTKGFSWGSYIAQDLGARGDFLNCIQFQRLGMARDRVFELSWSANCKTALSGAFIDATPAGS